MICKYEISIFKRQSAVSKQYVMFIKTWKVKEKKALASQPGEVTHAHACLSSKSCTRPLPVEGERECLEERTRERDCLDRSD